MQAEPRGPAPKGAPETRTLPVAEVRAGLRAALSQGDVALAGQLAEALSAALPQDYAARAAATEVLIRRGDAAGAVASARKAQGLAQGERQRFEAHLLRARAAGLSGGAFDGLSAGFWARRALAEAPLDGYRALARGEAARLRQAAPLDLRLQFSARPSSNVNNGSREETITLPGWGGLSWALSPQSRALSGWIGEAGLSGRYRLRETAQALTSLDFAAHHRAVRLSGEAKDAIRAWQAAQGQASAPLPRYDHSLIELGLSEQRVWGKGLWSLRGAVGHGWYGGAPLASHLKLEAAGERPFGPARLSLALTAEQQWARGPAQRDARIVGVELAAQRRFAGDDLWRLGGFLRQSDSPSLEQRHNALGLRLGWLKAEPVAGLRVEGSLLAEWRRYEPSLLAAGGRRDLRLDGSLALGLDRLEYMGFAPTVQFSLGRVSSNVRLYEGGSSGVSLRLRSVF